jgi:hypothetical protein
MLSLAGVISVEIALYGTKRIKVNIQHRVQLIEMRPNQCGPLERLAPRKSQECGPHTREVSELKSMSSEGLLRPLHLGDCTLESCSEAFNFLGTRASRWRALTHPPNTDFRRTLRCRHFTVADALLTSWAALGAFPRARCPLDSSDHGSSSLFRSADLTGIFTSTKYPPNCSFRDNMCGHSVFIARRIDNLPMKVSC